MGIGWDYDISSNIHCTIEAQTWAKGSEVSYPVYFCPLLSLDKRDVNFPVTAGLSCRCYLSQSSDRPCYRLLLSGRLCYLPHSSGRPCRFSSFSLLFSSEIKQISTNLPALNAKFIVIRFRNPEFAPAICQSKNKKVKSTASDLCWIERDATSSNKQRSVSSHEVCSSHQHQTYCESNNYEWHLCILWCKCNKERSKQTAAYTLTQPVYKQEQTQRIDSNSSARRVMYYFYSLVVVTMYCNDFNCNQEVFAIDAMILCIDNYESLIFGVHFNRRDSKNFSAISRPSAKRIIPNFCYMLIMNANIVCYQSTQSYITSKCHYYAPLISFFTWTLLIILFFSCYFFCGPSFSNDQDNMKSVAFNENFSVQTFKNMLGRVDDGGNNQQTVKLSTSSNTQNEQIKWNRSADGWQLLVLQRIVNANIVNVNKCISLALILFIITTMRGHFVSSLSIALLLAGEQHRSIHKVISKSYHTVIFSNRSPPKHSHFYISSILCPSTRTSLVIRNIRYTIGTNNLAVNSRWNTACSCDNPIVCTYHLLPTSTNLTGYQQKQSCSRLSLINRYSLTVWHTWSQYTYLYHINHTDSIILKWNTIVSESFCQMCQIPQLSFNCYCFHFTKNCFKKSCIVNRLICGKKFISFYFCVCLNGG